jgi:hypothetical protein
MNDTVNIRPTRLYILRDDLPREEMVICLAAGIKPGETLWLVANRPSSLGGYIGTFRQTYQSRPGYLSPTGKLFGNMPMRYFKEEPNVDPAIEAQNPGGIRETLHDMLG